jgi:peptidoglycan/LPS O-acetylase OafA/YrhL
MQDNLLFKRHYPELDLLRALAITMIMLLHYGMTGFVLPKEGFFVEIVRWGANGVDLFFALSGFLIGGQIIEEIYNGKFSFKRFFFKRLFRIFPPYYFSILVVVVLFFTGLADSNAVRGGTPVEYFLRDVVNLVFYLQNYTYSVIQNDVYWTLAIEEQFYIVAPVVLFLLMRYARRYFPVALIILIVTGIALRFVFFAELTNLVDDLKSPFHTRYQSLLLGVFVAYLFIAYNKRLVGLRGHWKAVIALLSVACLVFSFLLSSTTSSYIQCWAYTMAALGFSVLILFLTISSIGCLKMGQAVTGWIAKLSYTMYLYHFLLVLPFVNILKKFFSGGLAFFIVTFVIYYLVVVVISFGLYNIVDRPCMNYRRRVLNRWDGAG